MKQNLRKVVITDEAGDAVDRMVEDINTGFSGGKINRTDLLSWMAAHFEKTGYTCRIS
jgi:hypothetical protein